MSPRLALKRLTGSDLTLFAHQYRTDPYGKQKAINLNTDVFVSEFYPALGQPGTGRTTRFPVDLYLYGPGEHGEYNLQRKILKQEKNWRLDGELVYNPDDQPARFDILRPEDIALFEFDDDIEPKTVRIFFVAQAEPADRSLHSGLSRELGTDSMAAIRAEVLHTAIEAAALSEAHSIHAVLLGSELESIASGDSQTIERILTSPHRPRISAETLRRARDNAAAIGQEGEQLVNDYLLQLQEHNLIREFEWTSATNVVSPYDFEVTHLDGTKIQIDVKTTAYEFERPLFVSLPELQHSLDTKHRYDIYRVFRLSKSGASLRVAEDISDFAQQILLALTQLPDGVNVDTMSVSPSLLPFKPGDDIGLPSSLDL